MMETQPAQLSPHSLSRFSTPEIKSGPLVAHIESSPLPASNQPQNCTTTTITPLPTSDPGEAKEEKWKNIKTVALVVHEPKGDFKLETVYLDEVRQDEILVEMKYSGVCHTVLTHFPQKTNAPLKIQKAMLTNNRTS